MATDSLVTGANMDNSACTNTVVNNDTQGTSATQKSPINTPSNTTVALITDAINRLSTCDDTLRGRHTENVANFTDLPMEVLIMIAEILFAEYRSTRPIDTDGKWWAIRFPDDNLDMSFFAARRVSQAMRNATRKVFFQDKDLAFPWLRKGIDRMETRIYLEEIYAESVVQLQNYQNWPCRFCSLEKCLPGRCLDYYSKKPHWIHIQEATRQNLVDIYRDYCYTTSHDPEMLFNKGFRLGRETRDNRRGDRYTALYAIRVRDEEGNWI